MMTDHEKRVTERRHREKSAIGEISAEIISTLRAELRRVLSTLGGGCE